MNNAPFYVGEEVICIKSRGNLVGRVEKDKVYVVLGLKPCGCSNWWIDVGIRADSMFSGLVTKHMKCNTIIAVGGNVIYCDSTLFVSKQKDSYKDVTKELAVLPTEEVPDVKEIKVLN